MSEQSQIIDFSIDIKNMHIDEILKFLDTRMEELNPLIKKLENDEELDKESIYSMFLNYQQLLEIHRQMYISLNSMIENDTPKNDLYGYDVA